MKFRFITASLLSSLVIAIIVIKKSYFVSEPLSCCSINTAQEVRQLLAEGVGPNARNEYGSTLLMCAETREAVSALIDAGADMHATTDSGWNVLHKMAFRQHPRPDYVQAIIDESLRAGMSLDGPESTDSPLFLSVYSDSEVSVEKLLLHGASPHAKSTRNGIVSEVYTALNYAATINFHTINTLMLLKAGARDKEVDEQWTPLHRAAAAGNAEQAESLLRSGVEADTPGVLNCTPLMAASLFGHTRVVELLLAAGADIEAHNSPQLPIGESTFVNWTPLQLAAWTGQNDTIRTLLQHGADPNTRGNRNCTALHIAVRRGHEDSVRLLLESGADPNADAAEGEEEAFPITPLHDAEAGTTVHQLLLRAGAKK